VLISGFPRIRTIFRALFNDLFGAGAYPIPDTDEEADP
jgi:hypothetical protein